MPERDIAKRSFTPGRRIRRKLGWIGVAMALPFFIWLPAGFIPGVPHLIDTFGVTGLRAPAAVTITGLLLAAFGFHEA